MAEKKDLEETLKNKVVPLLEESMEKTWGITIPQIESDITDKLKNPLLQMYVPTDLTFSEAKKRFKAEFLKKELTLHLGNVSQLAKSLGIDRRSVHRAIKELDIDVEEVRKQESDHKEEVVDQTIRDTLDQYKELIQPDQLKKLYEEVPNLSRNIAQVLPHQDITWKQAEREFEKQFLSQALHDNKEDVSKTAHKLKIRVETLYRKIKGLGL